MDPPLLCSGVLEKDYINKVRSLLGMRCMLLGHSLELTELKHDSHVRLV